MNERQAHKKLMVEEVTPEGFDLRVDFRHPKTGLVVKRNPYVLRTVKEGGGSVSYFERPVGSGNIWDAKGNAIGRWDKTKPEGERFLKGEKHIEWTPPETADQKLARESAANSARIKELEMELAAIKAEKNAQAKKKDQGA